MPRIIISTENDHGAVMHTEWVTPADFQTEHFRRQLAERLAWAVEDAAGELARTEQEQPAARTPVSA